MVGVQLPDCVHAAILPCQLKDACAMCAEIRDLKRQKRHENNYQQAAKLMEVMFLKGTRFPKHSLVTEICDMTGVRKGEVIEWFQNRRREGKGGLYESAEEDWDEFK
jgi:hypothetical protein